MLNIIDLAIAGLILFYLLKNAGGLLKTVKNMLVVVVSLVILVIIVRLLLDSSLISGEARKMLANSYFVAVSTSLVKSVYPAVEDNAPKVNSFIKEKIISAPTPEVKPLKIEAPKISIPEKELEKLLEEIPKSLKKK
ncbi:MAG: hypothetical protein WC632_07995 [Candidatus Margulisiibacteriota bacterium]